MATRRDGDSTFDHGAQFIRLPKKSNLPRSLMGATPWFEDTTYQYFSSSSGMTQICKNLAKGRSIELEKKVVSIREDSCIHVTTECQKVFEADHLFLTCPLPQSLEILNKSNLAYPIELKQINYAQALVGLFTVETDSVELTKFKFQQLDGPIFTISNNLSKNVSSTLTFTVVMSSSWSEEHFEDSDEENLKKLTSHFNSWLQHQPGKATLSKSQLKKWRYSHPLSTHTSPFVVLGKNQTIYLLGDAFGGGSILGALRSVEALIPTLR